MASRAAGTPCSRFTARHPADPLELQGNTFIALRNAAVNGTGVLAIGAMAFALVLAARPVLLEPVPGGLDKMYRRHRWLGITGLVMAVLMAGGSAAAIVLLFRRAGHRRQACGTVEQITRHDNMRVLEVRLQLMSRWVGHAAGQFVFVRFDGDAQPHPFTLSSAWTGDGGLLLIKGLGDYTSALPARLHVGDLMRVEGPYGQFKFRKNARRASSGQIWIERDVWFCGPPGLGTALRHDLLTQGLPAAAFHQELFSFR